MTQQDRGAPDIVARLRGDGTVREWDDQRAEAAAEIERLRADYRDLARAYCRLKGIAPDELISDAGHEAWRLVAYDAVREERGHG